MTCGSGREWENVEQDLLVAQRSRLEALRAAAAQECTCKGLWPHHVRESFRLNDVDAQALLGDILRAFTIGRNEAVPVIVLAGSRGGEGKSLFLKALLNVFGLQHVFLTPEAGSFPLLHLPGKKVIFLDEWRFGIDVLSFATQCVLYDGSTVPITRPQNVPGVTGHYQYQGSAPILVTTKLSDIKRLQAAAVDDLETGEPSSAEASMIVRRLKVYPFTKRIPKPPAGLCFCGTCFSKAILTGALPAGVAPPALGGTWV